ncbi:unnamed protein product [Rotaria socialis]|uniref:G protein gamma domain-containing protein n=1 Tax=Rotaria socialis TaxID=392032 RepID=A0A817T8W1_9BILA|nr:unnamed protein product [Rotaria socialis]CAF3304798.1 unnamed protein product [Rotaria socialis]CAF3427915.1 unnamed protein product [Rotaria socialis]CAF3594100.1 unnamed protein product [Rotaria socialis]CAF3769873.1 unnamed protein product [Rotaria socialis]
MSAFDGNNFNGINQLSSNNEPVPNRHVSDNFTSSRSYAPEYHAQAAYATQRRLCEQLREEAKRERVKVSIVCKDLVRYITDHQSNDALVIGFQSPKENPFRDKQQCSLI